MNQQLDQSAKNYANRKRRINGCLVGIAAFLIALTILLFIILVEVYHDRNEWRDKAIALRDSRVTTEKYAAMKNERDNTLIMYSNMANDRDRWKELADDYESVYTIQIELVQDLKAALKECGKCLDDCIGRSIQNIGEVTADKGKVKP